MWYPHPYEFVDQGSEIALRSIREPDQVYADVRTLMQNNGYALKQGELLHEEQPDVVGVILECLGLWLTACFALGFTVIQVHFSGADTGAPGLGRTVKGATRSCPCPFCPKSRYTLPSRRLGLRVSVAISGRSATITLERSCARVRDCS